MAKVKVLVEGYAKTEKDAWYASPSTVLIEENGLKIIVDPGANKDLLLQAMQRENVSISDIDIVFLTHFHLDHIANMRLFPEQDICDGESIIQGDKIVDYSKTIPDTEIQVLYTPGHSYDHYSLLVVVENKKIAIAGDVIWWSNDEEQNTDIEAILQRQDPFVKDEKALLASRKMLLQIADFIVPGHGKMFAVQGQQNMIE